MSECNDIDLLDKAMAKTWLTNEEFEGERMYREGIMVLNYLLDSGAISDKEFSRFDDLLKKKYNPIIGGLI